MENIYSTAVLNRIVQDLRTRNYFLLDTFFPNVQVEQSEEIHFDTINKNRRLAPFVSPLVQGQIVERKGFSTNVFKPAYVKDKRVLDMLAPFKRVAGEQIGGVLSPEQRMAAIVADQLQDQQDMLKLRLELMAASILLTGSVTISGDLYDTVVVNFGRDAALTTSLSGAAEWGDTGVDPLATLEGMNDVMMQKSGVYPTAYIMDPKAWALFRSTTVVQGILNRTRDTSTLKDYSPTNGAPGTAASKGDIGGFNIFVYQNYYIDPADNQEKKMLPDYSVIGATPDLEGYRVFGAIRDVKAGLQAVESYTKTWDVEDPSVRYMMMQSAPLVVPYRPNASTAITVHA